MTRNEKIIRNVLELAKQLGSVSQACRIMGLGAVDGRGANAIVGNRDQGVVTGFGQEWRRFDQCGLDPEERQARFAEYFDIFPWKQLPADGGVGLDVGCGSGRWAIDVARRVRLLHAVDAST